MKRPLGRRVGAVGAGLALVAALAGAAPAQNAPARYRIEEYLVDSGRHDGDGVGERVAFVGGLQVPDAVWLRVHFVEHDLGSRSHVRLVSASDGGWQRLDARTIRDWASGSAIFNGNSLGIELHVAAGDRGVFFRVDTVRVGEMEPAFPFVPETLCGADDRVASGDNRVGRLPTEGCTAWGVTNGAFLTAGHCADFDPDLAGPLLPDGALDLSGPSSSTSPRRWRTGPSCLRIRTTSTRST